MNQASSPTELTEEQITAVAGGGNTIKIEVPTVAAGGVLPQAGDGPISAGDRNG